MKDLIENDDDMIQPTEMVETMKIDAKEQIAAAKIVLNAEKKKLTSIQKLDVEVVPNKAELITKQIELIRDQTISLEQLEESYKALDRTANDLLEEKIKAALTRVKMEWIDVNPTAGYLTDDERFVYIEDVVQTRKQQNVQYRTVTPRSFSIEMAAFLNEKVMHLPWNRLIELFVQEKRTYRTARYSVNTNLWNHTYYLPIKHMEHYFISETAKKYDGQEYSRYFDVLMQSLSGEKKENQDHIEKWIIHKVVNWRKAASTPDLVIVGHNGGNGKGIFHDLMQYIFPAFLVGKANAKTLQGDFNSILLGKTIVTFDDQDGRQIPFDKVKQLAGAGTMVFEPKGKDQYEGEKTHTSMWFSNTLLWRPQPGGASGGIDRRFSYMRSSTTFLEAVIGYQKETTGATIDEDEAKAVVERVVNDVFHDRDEVAKWFAHLRVKHPEVDENYTLKALHGEDYKYFLGSSANSWDIVWKDFALPALQNGGCIPVAVIEEFVTQRDKRATSAKAVITKLKDYAAQAKIDIEQVRDYVNIKDQTKTTNKRWSWIKVVGTTPKDFDWSTVSTEPFPGEANIGEGDWAFGS